MRPKGADSILPHFCWNVFWIVHWFSRKRQFFSADFRSFRKQAWGCCAIARGSIWEFFVFWSLRVFRLMLYVSKGPLCFWKFALETLWGCFVGRIRTSFSSRLLGIHRHFLFFCVSASTCLLQRETAALWLSLGMKYPAIELKRLPDQLLAFWNCVWLRFFA